MHSARQRTFITRDGLGHGFRVLCDSNRTGAEKKHADNLVKSNAFSVSAFFFFSSFIVVRSSCRSSTLWTLAQPRTEKVLALPLLLLTMSLVLPILHLLVRFRRLFLITLSGLQVPLVVDILNQLTVYRLKDLHVQVGVSVYKKETIWCLSTLSQSAKTILCLDSGIYRTASKLLCCPRAKSQQVRKKIESNSENLWKHFGLLRAGMLGFQKQALVEEPEDLDKLPTPQAPPPSWSGLDVETDLDVLLSQCFDDIQQMLTQWAMVTGPREHHSYSSQGSHTSNDSADDNGFQILPLLDSVTKMINSVKNYMHQRHDLSDAAFQKVRHAALNLLESLKVLETRFRKDQEDENGEYTYHTSEFGMLENERRAIHNYLRTVEKYAFNPPHHIGSPPAVFSSEIRALLARTAVVDDVKEAPSPSQPALGIPVWLERGSFQGDDLGEEKSRQMMERV